MSSILKFRDLYENEEINLLNKYKRTKQLLKESNKTTIEVYCKKMKPFLCVLSTLFGCICSQFKNGLPDLMLKFIHNSFSLLTVEVNNINQKRIQVRMRNEHEVK